VSVLYFDETGFLLRRIRFEPASRPGGAGLVRISISPGAGGCPGSALKMLLGMDATAPVLPEVPWASTDSVDARKATAAIVE
jgi:hypothetical protein